MNSRPSLPGVFTDQRGTPDWWYRRGDAVRAANVGGGFVLGSFVYVLALNYLRGGKPAVKQWIRMKFTNGHVPGGGVVSRDGTRVGGGGSF